METVNLVLKIIDTILTAALVGAALYGLNQVRYAKKALKTQSLRDSRKLTADYTYQYLDRIIHTDKRVRISKEQRDMLRAFRFSQSDDQGLDTEVIMKNNPEVKLGKISEKEEYIEKLISAQRPFTRVLNELEAFCAVVTSGLLDEELLYRAVGQNFVNNIEENGLEQVLYFLAKRKGLFTNVTEVYDLWALRLNVKRLEEVEQMNNSVGKDIDNMKKKLSARKRHTIDRIGVDD